MRTARFRERKGVEGGAEAHPATEELLLLLLLPRGSPAPPRLPVLVINHRRPRKDAVARRGRSRRRRGLRRRRRGEGALCNEVPGQRRVAAEVQADERGDDVLSEETLRHALRALSAEAEPVRDGGWARWDNRKPHGVRVGERGRAHAVAGAARAAARRRRRSQGAHRLQRRDLKAARAAEVRGPGPLGRQAVREGCDLGDVAQLALGREARGEDGAVAVGCDEGVAHLHLFAHPGCEAEDARHREGDAVPEKHLREEREPSRLGVDHASLRGRCAARQQA